MKRMFRFLIVLAALLPGATPAAAAWPVPTELQVTVIMPANSVQGETDPGQLVDVTLRGPGGGVKAVAREVSGSSGSFSLNFGRSYFDRVIESGDIVEVMLGGDPGQVYSVVCSSMTLTGVDLRTGVITGRVFPRQKRLLFAAVGGRIVPSPDPDIGAVPIEVFWMSPFTGVRTEEDGTFRVWPILTDGSWVFFIRRNDQYQIGYRTAPVPADPDRYSFMVYDVGCIPGIREAILGGNFAMVSGPVFQTYRGRLLSPAGTVKGRDNPFLLVVGLCQFRKRNGDPALMAPGDTIRMDGPLGFAARVPMLKARIDPVANKVTVLGPPGRFVNVRFQLFDALGAEMPSPSARWVRVKASGRAVIPLEGTAYTLHEGDRVTLFFLDRSGNVWSAYDQALPASP